MTEGTAVRIAEALERIATALERQRGVGPSPDPDEWLGALLPELARAPTLTAASALRRCQANAALLPLVAEYSRKNGAMAFGRRLAASVGVTVDGRCLVRRGDDRGVAVYSVRTSRTSSPQALIEKLRTSL